MPSIGSSSSAEFQPDALTRHVLNLDLTFHWIPGTDRFRFVRQGPTGDEHVFVDGDTGVQTVGPPPVAEPAPATRPDEVPSPDGRRTIFRREHDLWLRDLASGDERRITHDGEPDFAYGELDPSYDRQGVARRRSGEPAPLLGVLWSPDGRYVVAARHDLRRFPMRLFVTEYLPPDQADTHAHFRRLPLPADGAPPASHLIAVDVDASTSATIALDPQSLGDMALHFFTEGVVWWTEGADRLFLVTANHGGSRFAMNAVDPATGRVEELIAETAPFNVRLNPGDYSRPNVHVGSRGDEIVWYSERSGHGHLYLYDGTGGLVRRLTSGEWVVFDLLRVDEIERVAYFTAASRDPDANPYYRYLYRVGLDGGEPELLTPEVADHRFGNVFFVGATRMVPAAPQPGSRISPSGRYFVDSFSTTDQPPQYVLRRTTGEKVADLLTADARELLATGWRPPERVVAKAADGVTDLYGVITRPRGFDPARRYPVIDVMYPGPQGSFAPRTFVDQLAGGSIHHLQTFADAGFVVVAIDGRGTAHRSREFRDAFLGTEDVFGAADHVAAIRGLAADRPEMDLTRVGVHGQSFGGYGALRAMLLFPEFFTVGVAATGPPGYLHAEGQTNVERFFGVPSDSVEARAYYDLVSNTRLASRLAGRVLLVYGGIDESVPLRSAFEVFDAFIRADKDVDMLVVPDSSHAVPREPYALRRTVQYFVDHLTMAT